MTMTTWKPPAATRRGQYTFTSTLYGEAADGTMPADAAAQMRNAFAKLPKALASVGASLDEVAQVGVHIADQGIRDTIDPPWLELFPNPPRPSRRTNRMNLPPGAQCAIQATAFAGGKRTNYENPGLSHRNPLPMGAMVGNLFTSSAINGQVPNGALPADTGEQIDQAYRNVRSLLAQAGGSMDEIVHMWVFMKEELAIDTLVEKWLGVFPRDGDRPARKSFLRADLQGGQHVHMQFTALLGAGKRTNYEVPGVHHRDPIPMGARIGNLFMTSGVFGIKPDPKATTQNPLEEGLEKQLYWAFANLETMLREQGGSLEDVAHLGVLVPDYTEITALYDAIAKRWGASNAPAVHLWGMPTPNPKMRAQFYATAVL